MGEWEGWREREYVREGKGGSCREGLARETRREGGREVHTILF